MTQEDKQILLRDLCARLPYGTIVLTGYDQEAKYWNEQKFLETSLTSLVYEAFSKNLITFCKPYLRPMSSMTDEEKLDYIALGDIKRYTNPQYAYLISEQLDYLNARHFDYRGLIEKGLALEAPADMYKTE
jgi:hypothetical protein